mmetsp:Transcript_51720/g.113409  ORF Transcript_51720/g.113409 Transcript_51720/m.113409 type:complete len:261 (+) Transcript_51720:26-808(+)
MKIHIGIKWWRTISPTATTSEFASGYLVRATPITRSTQWSKVVVDVRAGSLCMDSTLCHTTLMSWWEAWSLPAWQNRTKSESDNAAMPFGNRPDAKKSNKPRNNCASCAGVGGGPAGTLGDVAGGVRLLDAAVDWRTRLGDWLLRPSGLRCWRNRTGDTALRGALSPIGAGVQLVLLAALPGSRHICFWKVMLAVLAAPSIAHSNSLRALAVEDWLGGSSTACEGRVFAAAVRATCETEVGTTVLLSLWVDPPTSPWLTP